MNDFVKQKPTNIYMYNKQTIWIKNEMVMLVVTSTNVSVLCYIIKLVDKDKRS